MAYLVEFAGGPRHGDRDHLSAPEYDTEGVAISARARAGWSVPETIELTLVVPPVVGEGPWREYRGDGEYRRRPGVRLGDGAYLFEWSDSAYVDPDEHRQMSTCASCRRHIRPATPDDRDAPGVVCRGGRVWVHSGDASWVCAPRSSGQPWTVAALTARTVMD